MFDLGGVIIDIDFSRTFACWAEYAGDDPERIAQAWSMDEAYQRHERGEISFEAYFETLRVTLDISITDDQFAEGWNSIYVGEIDGITDLLAEAKEHFSLYAFTNSNALHKSEWAPRFQTLLVPFERVFCSSDIGMRKPEARAFGYIAEEIGVSPERILFFDDHPENVHGAKASGLNAILFDGIQSAHDAIRSM